MTIMFSAELEALRKRVAELEAALSERSKAEDALLSVQRLAKIGWWEWDINTNEVRRCEEVYKILGVSKEDLAGSYSSFTKMIHPDDAELFDNTVRKSLRSKSPLALEYRVIKPDGAVIWLRSEAEVICGDDGKPVKLAGFSQDVTRARQMEDNQLALTAIMEATPDFVGAADPKGRVLYFNRAARKILGIGADEDISKLGILDTHPQWAGRIVLEQGLPTALDKGSWSGETAFLSKGGKETPASQVILAHKGPDGRLKFFSTIARDITERKAFEKALTESEERFRLIFEQNEDAVVIFDNDGLGIIDVNPSFISLFGYSKKELLRKGGGLFIKPFDMPLVKKTLKGAGERKKIKADNLNLLKKDGATVIASMRCQKVKLKSAEFVYATFRDMTEKMRLEEQASIIQSKLRHTNKMTSIGTLASGIAHEINNPNNFILINSEILSAAWVDAMKLLGEYSNEKGGDFLIGGIPLSEMNAFVPELLNGIQDGSKRIKLIVDNLKDFARADNSGVGSELDLNRSVMAATSILNNQISKYTDNFRIECSEDIPKLRGSSQKIEQVLINIIINALQSLPDRAKGVFVATSYNKLGKCAVVEVADEGAGMTREVLERVTEPFFTTKAEKGGTGLGLSISYNIIKEHKGSIEFASEPGKGTVVTIKLPLPA